MADKKIALFIDADNVSAKFGKQIIDALTARGEIFIRRIYGNWEKNTLHGWNECILNFSLRAVQQTDFVTGKNATDMSLTIDAMDVLYGGRADIFALVSNDSDFTPLAIRLREGGMTVVGIGNGQAANAFRMACSEFIDLDAPDVEKIQLVELKAQPSEKSSSPKVQPVAKVQSVAKIAPVVAKPKVVPISERQLQSERDKRIQQVHELLSEVAKTHGDAKGFAPLCRAGQTLRKKNLGFGIKQTGYSSFQTFVKAFPKRYELIYRTTGENFCFRCRAQTPVDKKTSPQNKAIQQLHDVLREATKLYGDACGFADLCPVGDFIKKKNVKLKDSGHATLQKFIAAFPDLYELRSGKDKAFVCCRTDAPKTPVDKKTSPQNKAIQQLHDVLRETSAYKDLNDDGGFTDLCRAGEAVKRKNLDVKTFGYVSLSVFVVDFPKLYEVRKVGNKFYYRCRTDDDRLGQLHDILREVWKLHAEADGFSVLNHAGEAIKNKNLGFGVKDFGYSSVRKFIEAFPDVYEVCDDGQAFRYRPR